MEIIEDKKIILFLKRRNLVLQYLKCKKLLRKNFLKMVDFKIRKPKSNNIYSFRINKKFRALGIFEQGDFRVFRIDDHQ